MNEKTFRVGKVRDAHGMKGELFVILFAGRADWLDRVKTLKLLGQLANEKGKHEPVELEMSIKAYKAHKKGVIVRLEEVSNRTQAEQLIGFMVEIPEDSLKSEKGESIFLAEIEGFEVFDRENRVGNIVGFSTNNAQDLLVVSDGTKKWEIPLVPAFVKEIRWEQKQIQMDLPEGLIG